MVMVELLEDKHRYERFLNESFRGISEIPDGKGLLVFVDTKLLVNLVSVMLDVALTEVNDR